MPSPASVTIASNEVLALFPTLMCRVQLEAESHEPLNRVVNARVNALIDAEKPLARGERIRTGSRLHLAEEFASLAELVTSNAEGVLSYLMSLHDGIEITACWADVRGPGARLSDETRVNAYFSALYFCRLPAGEARVLFRDPRHQSGILSLPDGSGNGNRTAVPVREGTLLLFPAWLARGVERNLSDAPSVSIGFDLLFCKYTESMSKPLWEGNTYKRA